MICARAAVLSVGGEQVPTRDERDEQLLPDEDQVGVGEVVHAGDDRIQVAVAVFARGDAEQGVSWRNGVVLHVVSFFSGSDGHEVTLIGATPHE